MTMELEKALQTTGGTTQLWQEDLSKQIYDLLQIELPLWNIIGTEQANGPIHRLRKRASQPTAWVQGELSDADFRSGTYANFDIPLKILRSWGGVSSFSQATTERWLNQLQEALANTVSGFANTMEWFLWYGNKGADAYQFDGVEAYLLNDATAKTAYTAGGNIYQVNAALTLTHLDNAIDRVSNFRGSIQDRWIALMSREMISRVSGLQTRVTRQITQVEYEGGFRMDSYRGIGLYPCNICKPAGTTTSPTVTATPAAGGTLTDLQRWYAISSVTLNGEQMPGTADDATTATTNNTSALTWTTDANAKLYKIWRGTTSTVADMTLLAVVPALTYDASGNITGAVTSYNDTGAVTPNSAVKPLAAASGADEQVMFLNVSKNERGARIMGAVSPLGDQIENYINYVPLATTGPSLRYFLEAFLALKIAYPTNNLVIRGAKLA